MTITTISTTITTEVTPGAGSYAANLTIAPTGAIITYGEALFAFQYAPTDTVTNFGHIINTGLTYYYGFPSRAISMFGAATLINAGNIHAASGIYLYRGTALINSGYIYAHYTPRGGAIETKAATLTNSGTLNAQINDLGASVITNTGIVLKPVSAQGILNNTGTITSETGLALTAAFASATNCGTIFGNLAGAGIFETSTMANSGNIWGGEIGAYVQNSGALFNTGSIGGGAIGILLQFDGLASITNAGTLSGSQDAILETTLASEVLDLTVVPGAVFTGAVRDELGTGTLILAGTTAGTLNMAGSFSGFESIEFAAGSTWSLQVQGDGEIITGLTPSDSLAISDFIRHTGITLAGFAATASTYITGAGLILSNATGAQTIHLGAEISQTGYTVITSGADTTLALPLADFGTIGTPITIGTPAYASPFLIPSAGVLAAGALALPDTYTDNQGGIFGGPGIAGITLQIGARLANSGTISGGAGDGVVIAGGTAVNSGTISGAHAISFTAYGTLEAAPGAVFLGAVIASTADADALILAPGTTTGTLDMGASFSGFSTIDFAAGASWTLEGTAIGLAEGQAIDGFTAGDTIILENFSAASAQFVSGTGFVLGNATASAILHIGDDFTQSGITVATRGADTIFTTASGPTNTIATEITLGTAAYPSPFTIPGFGVLAGGALALANTYTDNQGSITGITLQGGARLTNQGTITGDKAILIAGGTVLNIGTVAGSISFAASGTVEAAQGAIFIGAVTANPAYPDSLLLGPAGGTLDLGVSFTGFSTIAFASGTGWTLEGAAIALASGQTITGFLPGDTISLEGFAASTYGISAAGLILSNATASATIAVGTLPGNDGFVVKPSAAGTTIIPVETLINTGTITGATGPAGPFYYYQIPDPAAPSIPIGGPGGTGGAGLDLTAGTIAVNSGFILGGTGGGGSPGDPSPFVFSRYGGQGGYGGAGIAAAGGTLFNQGTIQGGAGGTGAPPIFGDVSVGAGNGGDGGAGLAESGPATTIINTGIIQGGAAGQGGAAYGDFYPAGGAGASGVGVTLSGGTLVNAGTIAGNGGVDISGGILIDTGTIASYTDNPAITFGSGAATLELYPGARLIGDAIANTAVSDTLLLAGSSAATAWINTELQNFSTVNLAPGATWTLEGSVSDLANGQTITGFAAGDAIRLSRFDTTTDNFSSGDTIILGGFAATSDSFVSGIGLVLSNATASATLAINPANFLVTSYGAASTIVSVAQPLINSGGIYDKVDTAVTLSAGYTLVNTGNIKSGYKARLQPPNHYGRIFTYLYSGNYGVQMNGSYGNISNALPSLNNTGYILGLLGGVRLEAGGEITNSGKIAGGVELVGHISNVPVQYPSSGRSIYYTFMPFDAIQNLAGAFTLTAEPGAVFGNAVVDDAGTGVLILAGTTASSLNAQDFSGFQNIDLAEGATWSLALDAPTFGSTQTITGLNAADTIAISHIQGAGTIELAGFTATSSSYASGTGLILTNATASETLVIAGTYSTASFTVTENADGGTDVSVACFCAGTRIATPGGNIKVENLRIGDLVKTTLGPRPIKWIGTRTYAGRFIANNPAALPIRIRRHAIAHNIPSRDLYVSPDHAICESGVLIHAHLLQNGISITQLSSVDSVTYFHLELDSHAIIFAENLATESFIDESSAHRFQNALTRPPSAPQKPCLPRMHHGFHLHNIKSRIARRAGLPEPTTFGPLRGFIDEATPHLIRGWVQDTANPEAPVLLEIFSGPSDPKTTPEIFSRPFLSQNPPEIFSARILTNAYRPDLRAAGIGSGCHAFSLALPNLQTPITIRRAQDHAAFPQTAATRHCEERRANARIRARDEAIHLFC